MAVPDHSSKPAKDVFMKSIFKVVVLPVVSVALWFCASRSQTVLNADEAPPLYVAEQSSANSPAPGTNQIKVVKPPEVADTAKVSPALQELAKLVQAGVSEDVILAYITISAEPLNVGSDQISEF